jgi:hypothetical protein
MSRQSLSGQISNYCMASAAFFLILALLQITERVPECVIPGPCWSPWHCPALGFGGAGLSKNRLKGAAIGLGVALILGAIAVALAVIRGTIDFR